MPAAPAAPRRRPVALVVLDLAAGAFVLLFTAVLGLYVAQLLFLLPSGWLPISAVVLVVFAWAGSLALFLIRAVQRRWALLWPVLGGVAIWLIFWAASALLGVVSA